MALQTIVWLLVLFVLAMLFVVVLRRMSTLIARTRDLERYQRAVASLDIRSAAVVEPLVRELDEARRHAANPGALRDAVTSAQVSVAELAAEARSLPTPATLVSTTVSLVTELDRAARAADMAEHGLNALTAGTRGRDLEAQTSLKRGALNLRHAREAIARLARDVAAVRPVDIATPTAPGATTVAGLAPYQVPGPEDGEGRFEPRM
jgi:hypothetical protein